ncbi:MAG: SH3 domain-containing protein [Bacteroidota bacterium]
MKNIIALTLTTALLCILTACGGGETTTTATTTPSTDGEEQESTSLVEGSGQAVCLWEPAGLRNKAGRKDAKYLTGVGFGEVVNLTGNEEEVASEKRTYIEVTLSDGTTGWINGYLLMKDAKPVIATADMDLFSRPDLSTLKTQKITSGTLFAISESQDAPGWAEIATLEKKLVGWTKYDENLLTQDPLDIALGKQLAEISKMKTATAKLKKLETLASSSTFSSSSLMPMVQEMIDKLDMGSKLPNTQLMITATNVNVRSAPDNTADNVVFQLSEGDICEIIQRGSRTQIREMDDYWYQIEKDGQQGWIYGFFTSKKL